MNNIINDKKNLYLLMVLSLISILILLLYTISLFLEFYKVLPKHFYYYVVFYLSLIATMVGTFFIKLKASKKKQFISQLVYATVFFVTVLLVTIMHTKTIIIKVIFPAIPFNTKELIQIDNQINDYYLVGVYDEHQTSVLGKLFILADPYFTVIKESSMDLSNNEKRIIGTIQKEISINQAIIAAYKSADMMIDYELNGFHIAYLSDFASSEFTIGDLVIAINGFMITSEDEFNLLYKEAKLNDSVNLMIRTSDQKIKEIEVTFSGVDKLLGVSLIPNYSINSPTIVTINNHSSAGPSGGLMMSLAIYDALTQLSYEGKYLIGGTGSINTDGQVGEIGGINQKIITAAANGLDYFFLPKGGLNEEQARAIIKVLNTKMQIIPVATLEDAIGFMEGLS